ncbi:MAG: FtsX-like permease family protein [Gammaproteobacteria bacterium]|nr:ABC transporter permease [Chromatiales bacterium]MDP6673350.1 FtsX-like permease family protein [Gammaproteobacteria bacterium]
MSSWRFAVKSLLRDLRAGELSVLLVAIIIAVTAMTAVGFFTDRVGRAIKLQAGAVLAGDVVVRAPAPLKPSFIDAARALGIDTAESLSFLTMVLPANTDNEGNTLSQITAVSEGYPLRGEFLVAKVMFGEVESAAGIPASGTGWAAPGLLGRMNLKIGDRVRIGEAELTISHVLEYQPNQMSGGMAGMAPGLLVNLGDVPSFNVIRPGSRATYREFFAGPEARIAAFRNTLEAEAGEGARVVGLEEAGAQINTAIDRAQRFLTLASLVTVILAAVATAMASRRYALRHLDTIALLKSVGATQSFVLNSTLSQLLLVIIGTATSGSLLGYFAQEVLVALAPGVLNIALPQTSWQAGSLGLLTAATITVGFALPHLLMLKNTAPIRVLRRDMPPPQLSSGITYGIAIGMLLAMVFMIVRDLKLVVYIFGGVATVAVLSFIAGWILVRSLTGFRGAAGVAWRYGLANISRRGTESIVQIVAFALSINVLLLLTIVRSDILEEWKASLPEDAPNYFLVNIDPEQWPQMRTFFNDELGAVPEYLPFIRGKIVRISGTPIDDYKFPNEGGRFFTGQETNFTWQATLPDTNRITAGQWWGEDYVGEPQASLDERIAERLGVGVGDSLGLNVGGEELEVPITSLRAIEWDSMRPNFYLMLSPGEVQQLPQTIIAAVFVPPDRRLVLNQFVRAFPGVTVFDLEVIMGQVRMVIERASLSVQYVFLFTLLSGVIVLLAAVQATRDERRFESALLHTLGARRSKILQGIAVEFTALGCLAGGLAAFGAMAIGWVLAEQVFQLDYTLNPYLWLIGLILGSVVVGVTGTWATRKAVTEPPVAVLREA